MGLTPLGDDYGPSFADEISPTRIQCLHAPFVGLPPLKDDNASNRLRVPVHPTGVETLCCGVLLSLGVPTLLQGFSL